MPNARQWLGKHARNQQQSRPNARQRQQFTHATERVFSISRLRGHITRMGLDHDPASRRRRRKGKSQIWVSKIWSRVPRDSYPRKIALARASSIYKRQTRLLVTEGNPQKQDRNCLTVINISSWAPDGARHLDWLTDWPTDRQSQCGWLWLELAVQNMVASP
jgi:hypothetical protein